MPPASTQMPRGGGALRGLRQFTEVTRATIDSREVLVGQRRIHLHEIVVEHHDRNAPVARVRPVEDTDPRVGPLWKRTMGLDSQKAGSLDKARLLFPTADIERKKDHGRAEALLLAEYGRRTFTRSAEAA